MSGSNCCFLTCIQASQVTGKVIWCSHLFKNFPQFVVIHTIKDISVVNETEINVSWNSLAFLMIQRMLAIWSLVPLALLKLKLQYFGHLIFLPRYLYAGQETTVKTGHGTTDWFHIGKAVHQGYILSPSLFNLYAEYIVRNSGLDEEQAGIKIARRNINNLRYADDTNLISESEELKSLLMKV